MNPVTRHFFRIDPRSLGLFRIVMGLVLIRDLLGRWKYIDELYTNEGVLPNHNHLFNLKSEGHSVWSALHSVSGDGEALVAFCIIFFVYLGYVAGFKTRIFQVLAFLSLLSLTTRNLLMENAGNVLALSLLGFTTLLPLGSRYSVDAVAGAMRTAREGTHRELVTPLRATQADLERHRAPGWSPTSVAAFGVLLQLCIVFFALSWQHAGAWKDGTAIQKALHTVRIASPFGFGLRGSGALSLVTHLLHFVGYLVPLAILIPVVRGKLRGAAAVLMALTGVLYGVLFNFGLFGWTLAASALLVISSDSWDAWATKKTPKRAVTLIYDADCGICFWLCKLVKRLDTRGAVTFVGNDALIDPVVERAKAEVEDASEAGEATKAQTKVEAAPRPKLPKEVNAELTARTVVAVDAEGKVHTEGDAVSIALRALPGLAWLGWLMSLPGLAQLANAAYRRVAVRRTAISTDLGLMACGTPTSDKDTFVEEWAAPAAPSKTLSFRASATVREILGAVLLLTVVTAATAANTLPAKLPQPELLKDIAWFGRFTQEWNVLVPEPAATQGTFVVDAVVKDERNIDTFTGKPPHFGFDQPFELGQLWSDYLARIQLDEKKGYQQAFRTYLGKGGPAWNTTPDANKIVGLDAYWIVGATMPDGKEPEQKRFYRHARGGSTATPATPKTPPPPRNLPGLVRPGSPTPAPSQ